MDLALALWHSLRTCLLTCDCLLETKLEVPQTVRYLPERPQDVWAGRLPTDLRVRQRQDKPRGPRGGRHHSAKQVKVKITPLGAQKPWDEPRVGRVRAPSLGKLLGKCLRQRGTMARDAVKPCVLLEDEPSSAGPDSKTPPGSERSPQPHTKDSEGKSRDK